MLFNRTLFSFISAHMFRGFIQGWFRNHNSVNAMPNLLLLLLNLYYLNYCQTLTEHFFYVQAASTVQQKPSTQTLSRNFNTKSFDMRTCHKTRTKSQEVLINQVSIIKGLVTFCVVYGENGPWWRLKLQSLCCYLWSDCRCGRAHRSGLNLCPQYLCSSDRQPLARSG